MVRRELHDCFAAMPDGVHRGVTDLGRATIFSSANGAVLRSAFPAGGRAIRSWLRDPVGSTDVMSMWASEGGRALVPVRRVRRRAAA